MAKTNPGEDSPVQRQLDVPGPDELVSALMDGELLHHDARAAIARFGEQENLRSNWSEYHMIGDALRRAPVLSSDVTARVARRLADEPTVLAPRRAPQNRAMIAWSAAASVAAVAVVGWVTLKTPEGPAADAPAFQQAATLAQLAPQQVRGNVSEYLIAHQEFSPGIAMQSATPYQRATYESQPDVAR
jgi:sigma-E factor negative regulatory protein RseA